SSSVLSLFFSRIPRPPLSTLLPYTTLFRSPQARADPGPRPLRYGLARGHAADDAIPAGRRAAVGAGRARHESGHRVLRLWREGRSEEHTSELQSLTNLVCRLLLEKKTHVTT